MASGNGISGLLIFKISDPPDTGVSGAPLACPPAHKFLATAMWTKEYKRIHRITSPLASAVSTAKMKANRHRAPATPGDIFLVTWGFEESSATIPVSLKVIYSDCSLLAVCLYTVYLCL